MGRLGRTLVLLSLAALLAGCGWNPGFGTGQPKAGPSMGEFPPGSGTGGGRAGAPPGGGAPTGSGAAAGSGQSPGNGGAAGNAGAPGGTAAQGGGKATGGAQGTGAAGGAPGGGTGGAPAPAKTLPPGQERLNQKVLFKNEVSLQFDTITINDQSLELAGSARDETSARDLARVDMMLRVYDSQGGYPSTGANLGSATVGSLGFRLTFGVPREPRYVILLDGLRVIRTPQQSVIPLARQAPLPGGGSVISYAMDDGFNWTVRIGAPQGVRYHIQLQWNDGRTFVPSSEQQSGSAGNQAVWELRFTGTPSEGRPAALQLPEYLHDYLGLNQPIRK